MEPSKAAMKAALRVLTALSERQEPAQTDVDELHWYAPPDSERPLDELACDAIQRALKDREERRRVMHAQEREIAIVLSSADHEKAPAAPAGEQRPEAAGLIREYEHRKERYQFLSARLQRLGGELQRAATPIENGSDERLASLAGEADFLGIGELLEEHIQLTRQLIADRQRLRKFGIL